MAVWVESTGEFLLCSKFSSYSFLEFGPITEQIGPISAPGIRHGVPGQALNVSGHPRCSAPGLQVPGFQVREAVGILKPCLQVIFHLAWLLREDGCFPLTVNFL